MGCMKCDHKVSDKHVDYSRHVQHCAEKIKDSLDKHMTNRHAGGNASIVSFMINVFGET